MIPNIAGMAHFLLVYDRAAGKLLRQERYASDSAALKARFAAEAEYGIQSNIEVLAVSAASEADLKESHGRYFLTSHELGERLVSANH